MCRRLSGESGSRSLGDAMLLGLIEPLGAVWDAEFCCTHSGRCAEHCAVGVHAAYVLTTDYRSERRAAHLGVRTTDIRAGSVLPPSVHADLPRHL